MKTIYFTIDDFTVGRKSLVQDLGFIEKEYSYFTRESSFYRKYNLELGLDACILELNLGEDFLLTQNVSVNPMYYFRVLEFANDQEITLNCSSGNALTSQELQLKKSESLKGLWFSFSQRWLDNKILIGEANAETFTKVEDPKICPRNQYFESLFNEIFEMANSSILNNFRLKIKLYAYLDQLISPE
jgi:hypothetical protein